MDPDTTGPTDKALLWRARSLTLAEHDERQRVAHVLHDDVQPTLVAALVALEAGDHDRVRAVLAGAVGRVRALAAELSPPLLRGRDLGELVEWIGTAGPALFGIVVDVAVDVDALDGDLDVEDEASRVLAYQLLRQLLSNVARHSGAGRALVTAGRVEGTDGRPAVRVVVEDGGAGFDVATLAVGAGGQAWTGLARARERATLVGGTVAVESVVGDGTRVTVELVAG